jgi:hypothetical protein
MNRRLAILGIPVAALALAVSIRSGAAHHSTAMYDHSKTIVLTGTVEEVHWVNPHVSILMTGTVTDGDKSAVTDPDKPSEWLLEMTSPGNLVRAGGWSRTAVKPGDKVVIEMSPLRDMTQHGGALRKLTLVDTGTVLTANIRAQEQPGLE